MADRFALSRRDALRFATAAGLTLAAGSAFSIGQTTRVADDGFIDVTREPAAVAIVTDNGPQTTKRSGERWEAGDVVVTFQRSALGQILWLAANDTAIRQVLLTWNGDTTRWASALSDQWERSYGDLQWRPPSADQIAPWYLLANTGKAVHAFGVRTQPLAFCGWMCEPKALTLVCDVRSGGVGVRLGSEHELRVCEIVARRGQEGESPYSVAQQFCRTMAVAPRLPDHPVYGCNDWYYAYGHNNPDSLIADAGLLGELTADIDNRPYCVIDDGWQTKSPAKDGQWSETRKPFGSMSELAGAMTAKNVRPGIWMRPLIDEIGSWPAEWHLQHNPKILDPTRREVLEIVSNDIQRLRGWGYKLIKHDFSTFDIMGRWGSEMMKKRELTSDGWSFANRRRIQYTTAEAILSLYRTIRNAAGDDVIVLGCNTVSHLSAGLFELNRTGDDTSGKAWKRIPQMGVNTLAFRGPQHGAFYAVDADCCPITPQLPREKSRQWLDLVSRSGTPLFVSVDRASLTDEDRQALRKALSAAARPAPVAEPLNWAESPTPARWRIGDATVTFDWS